MKLMKNKRNLLIGIILCALAVMTIEYFTNDDVHCAVKDMAIKACETDHGGGVTIFGVNNYD
jgi:cell division protein FtsL